MAHFLRKGPSMTPARPPFRTLIGPIVLGLLLTGMAVAKMTNFDGYIKALSAYDIVWRHEHLVGTLVIFMELVGAAGLLIGALARARLHATYVTGAVAGVLVAVFYTGVTSHALFTGDEIANATFFGAHLAQSVGVIVLVQAALLLAAAGWVVFRVSSQVRARLVRHHGVRRVLEDSTRWIVRVIVVLVAVRLLMPYAVEGGIDDALGHGPETWGAVGDVDMALYRGAYRIEDILVYQRGAKEIDEPMLQVAVLDIGLDWKSLLDGEVLAKVDIIRPRANFVVAEKSEQVEAPPSLRETLLALAPLDIQRFHIENGKVRFLDLRAEPKVDVSADSIYATATGLRTRPRESKKERPGRFDLKAKVMGEGRVTAGASFYLLAEAGPNIDLDAKLRRLPLAKLADFTNAYAGFDFEEGYLDFVTELAITGGKISGYAKPILSDHDALDISEDIKDGPLDMAWEAFVGATLELFENQGKGRFGTKIPLEGNIENPKIDIWATLGGVLSNAFLKALMPRIEGSVSLKDVISGRRQAAS